jgi:nicotinate-nucleotide pyrophosphorylase (carboxylating)
MSDLEGLVRAALAEDVGARARITQKAPGVVFGLQAAELAFALTGAGARVERLTEEGAWRDGGPVLEVEGTAAGILTAERTALNLLGRLSGVATLTARYVRETAGTRARVLDTRKTTPGLRALEKQAVRAGGGENHRFGLFDMVLIKENHAAMAGGVGAAVRAARERAPGLPLQVEVRSLDELEEALAAGAPLVMLDNMDLPTMEEAVRRTGDRAELEASGGVSLDTVGAIARTGVHRISVGALTHSAPALDLSLLLEPR